MGEPQEIPHVVCYLFFFFALSFFIYFCFYIYQWHFRCIPFQSDGFFVLFKKLTTCRNDKISAPLLQLLPHALGNNKMAPRDHAKPRWACCLLFFRQYIFVNIIFSYQEKRKKKLSDLIQGWLVTWGWLGLEVDSCNAITLRLEGSLYSFGHSFRKQPLSHRKRIE